MLAANITSATRQLCPRVVGCRSRKRKSSPRAGIAPDQLLSAVCGKARVPSAVRERLLVTFANEQQAQHQQLQQLQQKLDDRAEETRELQQKLDDRADRLDQETRERARWEVKAVRAQFLVQERTQALLVLKGCSNLRGLLEFVETEAQKSGGPIKNRTQLWKWILQQQPDLSLCIQAATNWREFSIPTRVQSLYDTLNKHHHVGKTPVEWNDVGGLKIEEGAKLSITDCRLLRCICEAYGIQAQVVPAASPVSDSESEFESESEQDSVAGSW